MKVIILKVIILIDVFIVCIIFRGVILIGGVLEIVILVDNIKLDFSKFEKFYRDWVRWEFKSIV